MGPRTLIPVLVRLPAGLLAPETLQCGHVESRASAPLRDRLLFHRCAAHGDRRGVGLVALKRLWVVTAARDWVADAVT
jgi:hypothetical protein